MGQPTQIGGYRVTGELGRGGAGAVLRGEDAAGRPVAIKVLVQGRSATPAQRQRFAREARALTTVRHPHVVALLDVGEQQGVPYLVLELHEGGSLEDRLRRGEPLAPREVARIGAELAEGLAAAHGRGVLHRDLKPGNVLFAASGAALLTDFGMAKDLGRLEHTAQLTRTGALQGTPGFWAPEQAAGELARIGPHTDVYGLGATLYAALCGRAPFEGASLVEVARATVEAEPPPLRALRKDVPRALEEVVMTCLARDPDARWADAAALADALRACARDAPARGRPLAARGLALASALGLALVGAAAALWARRGGEGPSPAPSPPLAAAPSPSATEAAGLPAPGGASPTGAPGGASPTGAPGGASPTGAASASPAGAASASAPAGAAALQARAEAALAEGRASEAVALLREAAAQDHPPALIALARLLHAGRGVARDDVQGLELLRRAATLRDPAGMCAYGEALTLMPNSPEAAAKAVEWLELARAAGQVEATFLLAKLYEEGRGAPRDLAAAARLILEGAAAGHVPSMSEAGFLLLEGRGGVARDEARAVSWFREAAAADDPIAIFNLAILLGEGRGAARDPVEAARWLRRGAELGDPPCMHNLGAALQRGEGVALDLPQAVEWFRRAAEAGETAAMRALGKLHQEGEGVARDPAQAAAWFQRAAEAGDAAGMTSFGLALLEGRGVAQDVRAGLLRLDQAAQKGDLRALHSLGLVLQNGRYGVPADKPRAASLYRMSADRGWVPSMVNLGLMLERGDGVAPAPAEAARYYRLAAERGDPLGMQNLALLLLRGTGVPRDVLQAKRWLAQSAEAGHAPAALALGDVCAQDGAPDLAADWYRRAARDPRYAPKAAEKLRALGLR
ncbi:MAG: serine/threonine-protein kinase [Planctomycetota bacterium]